MKKETIKKNRHGLGLRSKFLFVLLGSSIACTLVTAYQSLTLSQDTLDKSLTLHLESLRGSRRDQIENYFDEKRAEINVFSDNPVVIDAMKEFSAASSLLEQYNIDVKPEESEQLKSHYRKELLTPLKALTGKTAIVDHFMPKSGSARYLQSNYIVKNPAPVGSKQLYEVAGDGSYYSDLHEQYHKDLLHFAEGFGFYDLLLINKTNSQIVYSVHKELDYATSLDNGPYADTKLASIVRKVLRRPEKGQVEVSDYEPYTPSLGQPAAFFAAPIYDGSTLIGAIAAQIPVDKINEILTNDKKWLKDGLGKTGEVYIVGFDKLMRSASRFSYPAASLLSSNPNSKDEVKKGSEVKKLPSSVLTQLVDNESTTDALRGNTGNKTVMGYGGYKVMSSYAPLNIAGLDWALVVEKGAEEAKEPLTKIEKALLTGASITAAVMTLYALFASNIFIGPIQSILTHTEKINANEETTPLVSRRNDEFGQLTHSVNDLTLKLKDKEEQCLRQEKLLKERLLMIFPPAIADKVDNNETLIGDRFQNVAITVILLSGFNEVAAELSAQESVALLNRFINNFDEAAHNHGVDKITSQGNHYLAASGLMNPRLDYARNAVAFAEEVIVSIHRFNIAQGSSITARIGISSGEVTAGVIGKEKPIYNLMGDTVTIANLLSERTAKNSIRIDAPVYNQLLETDDFIVSDIISHLHVGEVANWEQVVNSTMDNGSEYAG